MTRDHLPKGWQSLTIDQLKADTEGSLVIGPFGSRMKANCYVPFGIPVIRGNNLSDTRAFRGDFVYISDHTADSMRSCNAYADDLVFPHRGAIGEVGIVPRDGKRYMISTSLMKLTCNRDLASPLFLFYFFRSPAGRYELLKNASTVGTPGIGQPLTSLRSISVPLPPLWQQHGIADILGSLDDKIELNRRMNETLEAMARALFKSWFVDFDPVHAKAAARREHPKWTNAQVSRAALPNLAPAVAELFPDSFEDSALGPIPAGWRVARIDEVATINGWTLGKKDPLDWIDYIEISEVMRGDIATIPRYRRGEEPSRARRRLRHGDTVLSTVRPDRGAYFLSLNPPDTLVASTGFAVITPTSVPWPWLACALTSHDIFEYLGHQADGGAYPAVNPSVIGAVQYAVPKDADLLNRYASQAHPWFTRAHHNRNQARQLAAARDSLLPRLLSGELCTSDAASIVTEDRS